MFEVIHYETEGGEDLFARWLADLNDRQAVARVLARVVRLELGLFGDCKPLDAGVWELRVDHGPGYRVYYAQAGRRIIMLLIGGDKRGQNADIRKAIRLWQDWQRRYHEKT